MPHFPDTPVEYRLLGPGPSGQYSAIFNQRRPRLASVNAGNPGLYVGGGTINLQFAKEVPQADVYQALHQAALEAARGDGGRDVHFLPALDHAAPVRVVLTLRAREDGAIGPASAGTVFLDVFKSEHRPFGLSTNYAMAYVVPPYGPDYHDDAAFLAAVARTAGNVARVVGAYNTALSGGLAGRQLLSIEMIRMCLFSGGQFLRPGVAPAAVARANHDGLAAALATDPGGLSAVEFESGAGEFASLLR